jgi:Peptidase_C39 like family
MTQLANFPEMNQHDGNVNQLNDCVPACIADMIEYLVPQDVSAGLLKNAVYGANYVGNTDPYQFVDVSRTHGVQLTFLTEGDLVPQIHQALQDGHPVLINITDVYSTDPSETHAVSCHGEDSEAHAVYYSDPFIGSSVWQSDQWIRDNIQYGYICVASKVEQEHTMQLPDGWQDDGTTLHGPNVVPIITGFRQWTLDHSEVLGQAKAPEYGANPIEVANPQFVGTRQDFDFGSLGWTSDRNVYQIALLEEVDYYKHQAESQGQPVVPSQPASPAPIVPLSGEMQLAQQALADAQKEVSDLQAVESAIATDTNAEGN